MFATYLGLLGFVQAELDETMRQDHINGLGLLRSAHNDTM